MRIEQTGTTRLQGTPQTAENALSGLPKQGETLTATVQSAEGQAVTLKTDDGRLLNARLAENASLMPNDRVEFLVMQNEGDSLVLRIAYVEPQQESASAGPANAALTEAETALLKLIDQMNLPQGGRIVQTALSLMREHGVSPRAALFFANNRIPVTPERVAAFNMLAEQGGGPGEALYEAFLALGKELGTDIGISLRSGNIQTPQQAEEVLKQFQELAPQMREAVRSQTSPQGNAVGAGVPNRPNPTNTAPQNEITPRQPQPAPQGDTAGVVTPDRPNPAQSTPQNGVTAQQPQPVPQDDTVGAGVPDRPNPAQSTPQNGVTAQQPQPIPQDDTVGAGVPDRPNPARSTPQNEATPQQPQPVPRGDTVGTDVPDRPNPAQSTPQNEVTPQQPQPAPQSDTVGAGIPDRPSQALFDLPERILSMFLTLTGDESASDVKRFVEESASRLETLKSTAEKYDDESMRSVRPRLEEASEQAKLAREPARFTCYQLPIHSGTYGTAELYVYRRGRAKEIDADNASVLIALPTESFGRVEALIRTENKSLSLSFSVEEESGIEPLKEGLRALRKSLAQKIRYRMGEMRVGPLKERTTVENAEAVLDVSLKKRNTTLDFFI